MLPTSLSGQSLVGSRTRFGEELEAPDSGVAVSGVWLGSSLIPASRSPSPLIRAIAAYSARFDRGHESENGIHTER